MLDLLKEQLIKEGDTPIEFDSDCREGICGTCGCMINGQPRDCATILAIKPTFDLGDRHMLPEFGDLGGSLASFMTDFSTVGETEDGEDAPDALIEHTFESGWPGGREYEKPVGNGKPIGRYEYGVIWQQDQGAQSIGVEVLGSTGTLLSEIATASI